MSMFVQSLQAAIQIMASQCGTKPQPCITPTMGQLQQQPQPTIHIKAPCLNSLNPAWQLPHQIQTLSCMGFINSLEDLFNKEIRFGGTGLQALLDCLSFALLAIGCKQTKYYPHMLTLIKQQFFKPGALGHLHKDSRNRVLNACRNIEIELISSGSVRGFLEANHEYLLSFQHILAGIVAAGQQQAATGTKNTADIVQAVAKKFNIDCATEYVSKCEAKCWVLGMQRKVFLIEEKQLFLVVSESTSTEPHPSLNDSAISNRLESEREGSEFGLLVPIQASEESTPKFKQNQESIRYRKKSHKNSFGGDFQSTPYKQLGQLISRNQQQNDYLEKQKKVFSLKFQMQEAGLLTLLEQVPENGQKQQKNNQMRGSNIEGNQARLREGTKHQANKSKKHITSSQIFNLLNGHQRPNLDEAAKVQEQDLNNSSGNKNSGGQGKLLARPQHPTNININININQTQNIQQPGVQEQPIEGPFTALNFLSPSMSPEKSFKFSFSKKDSQKFQWKQIQSEYNDNEPSMESELQYPRQMDHVSDHDHHMPIRSSLTQMKPSEKKSLRALYEGHFFKKEDRNRKSLLLEASIKPIQQEVQSSQQQKTEQQNLRQIENSEQQNQELERKSVNSHQVKHPENSWANINGKKNADHKNMAVNKNRKFSYLTHLTLPQSSYSKNSAFAGRSGLRESYLEQGNQIIPESPHEKSFNFKNIINSSRNHQSKGSKSPKTHKNSEAITSSKPNNRKYIENPIRMSLYMVQNQEESNYSAVSAKNLRHRKLALCSNTVAFRKHNEQCYNEPAGWVRKEVIYYFPEVVNQQGESVKKWPERYIIDRHPMPMVETPRKCSQREIPEMMATQSPGSLPENIGSSGSNIRQTLDTAVTPNNINFSVNTTNATKPATTASPTKKYLPFPIQAGSELQKHSPKVASSSKRARPKNQRRRNNSIEYVPSSISRLEQTIKSEKQLKSLSGRVASPVRAKGDKPRPSINMPFAQMVPGAERGQQQPNAQMGLLTLLRHQSAQQHGASPRQDPNRSLQTQPPSVTWSIAPPQPRQPMTPPPGWTHPCPVPISLTPPLALLYKYSQ